MRAGFEAAGYTVVGTATSGQAARGLSRDAGIESRTMASLLWNLDHGRIRLTPNHVVIVDEAGMSDDQDLLRVLTLAGDAGSKSVMVGDDRQLGAVGPGGTLGALMERHQPGVHVLDQNVRQDDPTERRALKHLRDGDVSEAVDWMAGHGRIATGADRTETLDAVVAGWIADIDAGKDTSMYAWRRANVEALNRSGRQAWDKRGRLRGPEIEAPGGRTYRAGDRIVTLAPGGRGQIVTSERGTIHAVNPIDGTMGVRMADGRLQHFEREETDRDRLAHGYAVTVHRSQGATVDTAHRFEDGGGRELAYVSMSRARQCSTVYVTADDLEVAVDDLKRDWRVEGRKRWAIDTGTPTTDPAEIERDRNLAPTLRNALLQARLQVERQAVMTCVPGDVSHDLRETRALLTSECRALAGLDTGSDRWSGTKIADVADVLRKAQQQRESIGYRLNRTKGSEHREAKKTARYLDAKIDQVSQRLETITAPQREALEARVARLEAKTADLESRTSDRADWFAEHPETARRLDHLDKRLHVVNHELENERDILDGVTRPEAPTVSRSIEQELLDALPEPDLYPIRVRANDGPDLGIGL